MGFISVWVVVTNVIMSFFEKCIQGSTAGWLAAAKACAINSVTTNSTGVGCSQQLAACRVAD